MYQVQSPSQSSPGGNIPIWRSILFRQTVFVALIVILTGSLLTWVAYYVARVNLRNKIHQRLQVVVDSTRARIEAYVEQEQRMANMAAGSQQLRGHVKSYLEGRMPIDAMITEASKALGDPILYDSTFKKLWVTDSAGKVIVVDNLHGQAMAGTMFSDSEDFQQGRIAPHFGTPRKRGNEYLSHLAAPLVDQHGTLFGVLMAEVDVSRIIEIMKPTEETDEILLGWRYDDQIRYLLPSNKSQATSVLAREAPFLMRAVNGDEGASVGRRGDVDVLAVYGPVSFQAPELRRWGLVSLIPVAEAYRPLVQLRNNMLVIQVVLLVAGVLVAFLSARRLTRPVLQLAERASAIANGDWSSRATIRSNDELRVLGEAFNHMANQLSESYATLEQRVAERTDELADANEKLTRATDEARAANRAKSAFVANLSHEIRTPMNAIIGMTDLVLDGPLERSQREYLKMVQESGETLLSLINDILDFSKIESGKLELESIAFELRDRVGDAVRSLCFRSYSKGLELNCSIRPDVPDALVGDPSRLRQIIVNLIGNAIKFTEQGEIVATVQLDSIHGGEAVVHFAIADTGIGIPSNRLDSVFNAFEQADVSTTRKFGGTGLGLAICKRLAEAMGGRIWVESVEGQGCVFHFTARLELAHEQPGQLEQPPTPESVLLQGKRVLAVDDNDTNRTILDETLRSWGIEVQTAANFDTALNAMQKALEAGQQFDLVVTDCDMPDKDGFELAEEICRRQLGSPPIVLLTSTAETIDQKRCERLRITSHLLKPVKNSELANAIRHALGAPEKETKPAETNEHKLPRLRILLAEDSTVNQKLAVAVLNKYGHEVQVAVDGRQAVQLFDSQAFDLILMDVQMPEMDGYEATALIRAREENSGNRIPIVAMTANAMKGDREICLAAGMDEYVSKPIRATQLFDTLAAVLQRMT